MNEQEKFFEGINSALNLLVLLFFFILLLGVGHVIYDYVTDSGLPDYKFVIRECNPDDYSTENYGSYCRRDDYKGQPYVFVAQVEVKEENEITADGYAGGFVYHSFSDTTWSSFHKYYETPIPIEEAKKDFFNNLKIRNIYYVED